ncbi:TetR/AcrR family transcriptional regulator [Sulfuriferula nivalis]|uniref:TetR family transcriptional regulator n=1 Tax=Sulfuriferula nivalis TaxID=2675298 RepID=A0A809SI49_9PROT|nr:TetR/AcrR family transcriptional regulator [Sulfuriferula nivalis]BBP01420.1 TetR family transcriptional regulator [Sulfuriferula nivalis]
MENIKQDITRQKLLQSAYCEIHQHGFQGASIANILKSTELTKGALYHHFPTKHALGLAVIDEIIEPQLDALVFQPLLNSPHPVTTLLEIISGVDTFMGEEGIKLGCPLNNLMQEMSPLDDQFRHQLNVVLEAWQQAVYSALEHGQQHDIIKAEIDIKAAALFVVSAWEGCLSIAKNKQSPSAFSLCMTQLHGYVRSLLI